MYYFCNALLPTLYITCIFLMQAKEKPTNILSESQTENDQITLVYMKKEKKNEE